MSHFTVLVIGDDPEDALEPFWELDLSQEDMKSDERAEFSKEMNKEEAEKFRKEKLAEIKNEKDREKEEKMTLDDFMRHWGYVWDEGEEGYGYWYNPNAKWDWYSLGGRWCGYFKIKEGVKEDSFDLGRCGVFDNSPEHDADQALKKDIDWEGMRKYKEEKAKGWYKEVQELIAKGKEDDATWKLGWEKGMTEEDYIAKQCSVSTFAVIKDGEWYEKGSMGWWGMVSDEKSQGDWDKEFDKLIESLPEDTLLSLYDCHI